jgi:molecular chaperone DnaK (HSP70)
VARYWAIDLGTTNTVVAAWDEAEGGPMILRLAGLMRPPPATAAGRRMDPPAVVPSAVFVREPQGLTDWIGRWRFFDGRCLWGCQGLIGQAALERQQVATGGAARAFADSFKPLLGRTSQQPVAQTGRRAYSVRQVTHIFLRELLAAVHRQAGIRLREVVFTVPVGSFETYREELRRLAQRLGIRRFRTLDEPVAAALGYGLNVEAQRTLLVVDFGGGSLDVAVVRTGLPGGEGRAEVVAKEGEPLGGNHVDVWLLEEYCRRLGFDLSDREGDWYRRFWRRTMLDEARRVKEELHLQRQATFHLEPAADLRIPRREEEREVTLTRQEFMGLLEERGLYRTLADVLERVLAEARRKGVAVDELDDVLLVGGSTLLPGVQPLLERHFGRGRLRDWQPFEAVAYGACIHAAGQEPPADFIRHDYALLTINRETREEEYRPIIPQGTPYPTRPDFYTYEVTPVCPRGTPQEVFELIICELGRAHGRHREFFWNAQGEMQVIEAGGPDRPVVVKLNEADPVLGRLNPRDPGPGGRPGRIGTTRRPGRSGTVGPPGDRHHAGGRGGKGTP